MAVYMNAKGTQSAIFQFGKRGSKVFGSTVTPSASDVNTGDLWFDISNNETKIASKSGDTVTWNKIITENFGDLTVTGNLTVQGTTTTVDSTSINIQNSFVFEGATDDAHEPEHPDLDQRGDQLAVPGRVTLIRPEYEPDDAHLVALLRSRKLLAALRSRATGAGSVHGRFPAATPKPTLLPSVHPTWVHVVCPNGTEESPHQITYLHQSAQRQPPFPCQQGRGHTHPLCRTALK